VKTYPQSMANTVTTPFSLFSTLTLYHLERKTQNLKTVPVPCFHQRPCTTFGGNARL
jgi:hypothetical protein